MNICLDDGKRDSPLFQSKLNQVESVAAWTVRSMGKCAAAAERYSQSVEFPEAEIFSFFTGKNVAAEIDPQVKETLIDAAQAFKELHRLREQNLKSILAHLKQPIEQLAAAEATVRKTSRPAYDSACKKYDDALSQYVSKAQDDDVRTQRRAAAGEAARALDGAQFEVIDACSEVRAQYVALLEHVHHSMLEQAEFYKKAHELTQQLEPALRQSLHVVRQASTTLEQERAAQMTAFSVSLSGDGGGEQDAALESVAPFAAPGAVTPRTVPSPDGSLQGWLYKQSTGVLGQWKRRWFVLDAARGELFHLRGVASSADDELQRQGVLRIMLCKAQEQRGGHQSAAVAGEGDVEGVSQRAHTFVVKAPNKSVVLQAPTAREKSMWMQAITSASERQLYDQPEARSSSAAASAASTASVSRTEEQASERSEARDAEGGAAASMPRRGTTGRLYATLRQAPENRVCADCGAADPSWLSVNHATLVCIQCSGAHRSVGTHVSKVQSLTLDSLPPHIADMVTALCGNRGANRVLEARREAADEARPSAEESIDGQEKRMAFVRRKYEQGEFVDPAPDDAATHATAELWAAAAGATDGDEEKLGALLRWVVLMRARGALNAAHETQRHATAVHAAASGGHCATLTLLAQNGGKVNQVDSFDQTPLHYAAGAGHREAVSLLLRSLHAHYAMVDADGNTPEDEALANGHEACAQVIVDAVRQKIDGDVAEMNKRSEESSSSSSRSSLPSRTAGAQAAVAKGAASGGKMLRKMAQKVRKK